MTVPDTYPKDRTMAIANIGVGDGGQEDGSLCLDISGQDSCWKIRTRLRTLQTKGGKFNSYFIYRTLQHLPVPGHEPGH